MKLIRFHEVLTAWGFPDLEPASRATAIFEKVRDIPFGRMGSRDPWEVYRQNKGTCSGKSFLLRELFQGIGLQTRDMICLQRWRDLTWFPDETYGVVNFPNPLQQMLETVEIVDFHNYLQVRQGEKWLTVDASIDLPLTELGFYTTEHWDGESDMPLCFAGSDKVWACGDRGEKAKQELTGQLPEKLRAARNEFLEELTRWIDVWREKMGAADNL